jgi:hypothetical protein
VRAPPQCHVSHQVPSSNITGNWGSNPEDLGHAFKLWQWPFISLEHGTVAGFMPSLQNSPRGNWS